MVTARALASLALALLASCQGPAPFTGSDALDTAAADTQGPAPDAAPRDAAPDAPVDAFMWGDGAPCLPAGDPARGRAVAMQQCTICHGVELGGGLSMYEPPGRNLHNDGVGAGGRSDCDLQAAARRGLDRYGYPLCIGMPHFTTDDVSDQELGDVYAYMRSLTGMGTATATCE